MDIRISGKAPMIPHHRHWQFCVGSGHALLALRTDYAKQLKFIHDTLGIKRVRFHGIFCDDMRTFNDLSMLMPIPGSKAFEEYNFNSCGVAYDNVLEAGMKPFVELSFMPEKLARVKAGEEQRGLFFYKPIIVPPADIKRWQDYIQAFLRFLIHRYGIEEIRTWFFEVWNEPDLPTAFWNGSRDEYFELYAATAKAIKDIDSQIRVGGPSTSNSKWISSFLYYCKAHDVPVDFVSTHQYAGDPLGGVEDQGEENTDKPETPDFLSGLAAAAKAMEQLKEKTLLNGFRTMMPDKSETTDIPYGIFPENAEKVRSQAGNLPVYYTEWNENAIFSAATNDTRKVAAYDVRAALEVSDFLDGSSVWCFSDIFEELHPFPQEFHGGFGMLTQNGIPKPVYHALKMLHDAGDERFDLGAEATRGEIGYAAFKKDGAIQILLFRQHMKNEVLPDEPVHITLEHTGKPQAVSVRRIDETHGNPLKNWQEMGSPVSLSRAEVQTLIRQSRVEDEPWAYTYTEGQVQLTVNMGVNDVCFITVTGSIHFI